MERSSEEPKKLYFRLFRRIWPFKGWEASLRILFPRRDRHGPILSRPVSLRARKIAELKLKMPMPEDLWSFYRFSNGLLYYGRNLIYPLDRMIEVNKLSRALDINMPVDHLLFFGETGDGDQYAFGRRIDGQYHHLIFVWRHETDERAEYDGLLKLPVASSCGV
jgi:hypothetical protein